MRPIYFNWLELKSRSENHFEGILILTYCLKMGYNKTIADSSNDLMKRLGINYIPFCLIKRKLLITNKYKNIISNYKCNDPQNYFLNDSFIYTKKAPLKEKIIYLYLLSQRSIDNKDNFIPKYYVEEKYWNNYFIEMDSQNLNFKIERT